MKQGCVTFFIFLVTIIIYIYFANKVNVPYNKVDTLYMVSTIFYSAVIGMVISNNVHLENGYYREKIRGYYNRQRNLLTAFFIITTALYFILDIRFFQCLSVLWGVNLPLITLLVIILFIIYNLISMRVISSGVAMIEDNDLTSEDVDIRKEMIRDYVKENKASSLSRTLILKIIDVANTKDNEEKYIKPLVDEDFLKLCKRGNVKYYKYQNQENGNC